MMALPRIDEMSGGGPPGGHIGLKRAKEGDCDMPTQDSRPARRPIALLLATATIAALTFNSTPPASAGNPDMREIRRRAMEYIGDESSIELTAKEKATMDEALSSIKAPCCSSYSMATCCCPCNLAKSVWGLSKVLIHRHHYGSGQVRLAVTDWLASTNPDGYSGDACFTGGCGRAFDRNGCGGMDTKKLVS
jgi:hypothetical protein